MGINLQIEMKTKNYDGTRFIVIYRGAPLLFLIKYNLKIAVEDHQSIYLFYFRNGSESSLLDFKVV